MDIIYIVLGLILLFAGGEVLLKASISIAGKLGLSALLVSMVVIGFGTSTPELIVTLSAAFKGSTPIAFGNVVGSNIANVLLILGIASLTTPMICKKPEIHRDAWIVLAACTSLAGLSLWGTIERWVGLSMVLLMVSYMAYSYRQEKRKNKVKPFPAGIEKEVGTQNLGWIQIIILTIASLGSLAAGSWFLVEGSTAIAARMGIPESVIGLTLVAVGSSLPELTMVILAAARKNSDVIMGNILGSNLFNTLGILGITSMAIPLPFPKHIAHIDIWVMLGIMVLLIPITRTGHRINRFEGAFFLCLYSAYIVWLYTAI
tara:strand:- start:936 stop:1886 length:951 start_codon:yes stop_codon:yes gene_type:complete